MIRVPVSEKELLAQIGAGWLARAKAKRAAVLKAGTVGEKDGIWSEVKELFIILQRHKCAYCEFPMQKVDPKSAAKVKVEYDVEHFRPKNQVTGWPTAEVLAARPWIARYRKRVRNGSAAGYVRLAFEPSNYLVSCKTCNTSYKLDRFPIAGQADGRSGTRAALDKNELPLLLFPFGDTGDDPAEFLAFLGPTISARPASGTKRLRARAVIDFFELDTRASLFEGRCQLISLLWPRLEERRSKDPAKRRRAERWVRVVLDEHKLLHTACGRAYVELYEADRRLAARIADAADEYLISQDPDVFGFLQGRSRGPRP
jgi:hypothetical protein